MMIDKYQAQRLVKGSTKRKNKYRQKIFLSWYEYILGQINEEIKQCAKRGETTAEFEYAISEWDSYDDELLSAEELQETSNLVMKAIHKKLIEQDFEVVRIKTAKEILIDITWK